MYELLFMGNFNEESISKIPISPMERKGKRNVIKLTRNSAEKYFWKYLKKLPKKK